MNMVLSAWQKARQLAAGGWLKRALFVFLVTAPSPVGAQAGETGQSSADDTIVLYRPISYYQNNINSFNGDAVRDIPAEQALQRVLARLHEKVEVRYVPLKRAMSLFRASEGDCLVAPYNGKDLPDIVSDVFYVSPFWLFVLNDSPVRHYRELKTVGMIDGADRLVGQVLFGDKDRTLAPTFQSLIAMLLSGRVEAIPLGELALANEPTLQHKIRRLTGEPDIRLDMRIRCKHTPRNEWLISAADITIAALRREEGPTLAARQP
jgi:hypothetical protein